jgi:ABC-2 type transport system permease protein
MMFGYNVLWISRRIGRGQLDHLLIQPRPLWKALLTEGFIPSSMWPALIPGITLTAWSLANIQMTMDFAWWAAYTVNLLSGVAIVTAFSYIWGSLAFWAPVGAEELSSNVLNLLSELKPFPLDGLGRGLKMSLLSIIPAGFVAWFPAGALLGFRDTQTALLVTPVAALALGLLAALIFKRGLAHYARTGSQRYTDFGHRR